MSSDLCFSFYLTYPLSLMIMLMLIVACHHPSLQEKVIFIVLPIQVLIFSNNVRDEL